MAEPKHHPVGTINGPYEVRVGRQTYGSQPPAVTIHTGTEMTYLSLTEVRVLIALLELAMEEIKETS